MGNKFVFLGYVGVRGVQATPMTKNEFYRRRHKKEPEDNADVEGYLVNKDGYESWSPKDVFEEAYVPLMDEDLIERCKSMAIKCREEVAQYEEDN